MPIITARLVIGIAFESRHYYNLPWLGIGCEAMHTNVQYTLRDPEVQVYICVPWLGIAYEAMHTHTHTPSVLECTVYSERSRGRGIHMCTLARHSLRSHAHTHTHTHLLYLNV